MSKSQQRPYSTVLSTNPYKGDWYTGTLNTISQSNSPAFSKEQLTISFLNTKSFITTLIGISKNIPDDDILDALETKVYEELALDMAIEYHIKYIEAINRVSDSERYFHVFVVDPLTLEEDFNPVVDKVKYIDHIIPVPLLLKSLYSKEYIENPGTHCFIYFQENDAFFCIYDDQEYIYSKSLKFSLIQMHERFCELLGEQIELNSFISALSTDGFSSPSAEYQKNMLKLFGEIFLHISDIMTYSKRAYEIKKFDEIYIGTAAGAIAGLDEYAQTYLGIKTSALEFDYGIATNGAKIEQMHQLMHLYGRLLPEERYDCNFTIFHRPPPFAKRDSGKLILVTAASLAAALMYPGVYWGLSYAEEFRHALLSDEYNKVHAEKVDRETNVNQRLAAQKAAQTLLDEQQTAYKQKQDTLIQVHEKKVNYPMKAKILSDFTRSFNQYHVQLKTASYYETNESKTFAFGLTSSTTQNTTALVKHLTETKQDHYTFYLDLISYDENEKSYLSELKAVLK